MPPTQSDRPTRAISTLVLALFGLVLLGLVGPAYAADGDGKSWGGFFGRLHVVVLHLPIGLLIGAFTLEVFGLLRRSKGYDIAAAWLFVLGALSAVVAVASGMLLGLEEAASNADPGKAPQSVWQLLTADTAEQGVSETLGWHMWLGITLMIVALVAAVLKVVAVRRQWPDDVATPDHGGWPLGVARLALIGAMTAMPFAGHLGGNMTHTPTFLFERAPFDVPESLVYWPEQAPEQAAVAVEGVDYKPDGSVAAWNGVIQPALNNSCISCHGTTKKNGGVQLHTLRAAFESEGFDYPVITAGDAQFSSLHTVITLPQSHDYFMPPDPKDALDNQTVQFIGEWIQNFDGKLEDPAPKDNDSAGDQGAAAPARPVIDPVVIRAIEDAGGSAQSVSQEENPELLAVKFAYIQTLDPEAVAKIGNAADKIADLAFDGSGFNDANAQQLSGLPKLTRLNLKDTAITDAGLAALPDMPRIEWLNLFGTEISDAGIDALKRYGTLKKLYVTGTAITEQGVARLRTALPETEVYSDFDDRFNLNLLGNDPEPEGPINKVCPVSGAPVKDGFVSTFEGKTVGFCCNNCKGQFDADPAKFKDKIVVDAD